ncbi:outer membrane transport energization protein TonB [Saccharicrinis carchari]|uniref:Outer membrane transport energization protein TonB n=1 Tax=Saccharicrinis carchari TaxID=1168039 RepID=A0A521F1P9_SACCC|nr:M56 family metallopeptidase [Saccharicrinis carchari]SMO90099.1 outer membrane transport energization protein TonB [Saccharicrinis carchari]
MEYFINYLLESSLILGVLALFYRTVLHHEPFFKLNRVYLLLSLTLATVVPFVHISVSPPSTTDIEVQGFTNLLQAVNVYADEVQQTVVPVIAKNKTFGWLYLGGALAILLRLLFGLTRLGLLSKKARWIKYKDVRIADLPGNFNAFSFFHVIFVNRSLYTDDDLDKILVHEMSHVKHRHSLDVLLFEALLIVQWFNPFAWWIKNLLRELHEFQADRSVLNKGTAIGSYKKLLLHEATGARLFPVNNFNQSITKKRFKMMTNKTIKNKAFIKGLAAFFMIVSVAFFFACDRTADEELQQSTLEELQQITLQSEDMDPTFFIVEVMPQFPGGDMELRKYIAKSIKYPVDAQEQRKMGRVYVQFVVSKTGDVKDVKVLRSGGFESLDEEALRVVRAMPKWTPGLQRGQKVNVSYTIPINFVLQSNPPAQKEIEPIAQENDNEVIVVGY